MDRAKFIEREKVRGECYRLLAACFYQPEKDVLLRDDIFHNLALLMNSISPEASALARQMLETFLRDSEEELSVDYAKLFVGPSELLAPPYGSVYLDGNRRVMGDSTMEVMRFYQEEGLAMDADFRNLPDHITAELEFMYYLIFKEIEALEKLDITGAREFLGKQEFFLEGFLSRWIGPFCDKMKARAGSGFYRALAGCTAAFIKDAQAVVTLPELLPHSKAAH